MAQTDKRDQAFRLFDAANEADPHTEVWQGKNYPKELLYAIRMTEKLSDFAPEASEALQLAARCQHIRRWEIPRESYDMDREGYLRWRQDLKKFHARKAAEILEKAGYDEKAIEEVTFLLEKKQLKRNKDTQTLEDVICLVFLQYYLEPFAKEHSEDKLVEILRKTWRKMSAEGQQAAMRLPLSRRTLDLVSKALDA